MLSKIKGDKTIWAIVTLLALFSFLPVYSASTNLVYVVGNGTTVGHLLKHAFLLLMGFGVIYAVHRVPYHYFKGLSFLALPLVLGLLAYTLAQGTTIGGANASRWIRLPFVGISFQTSTLAAVVLMAHVARYLSNIKGNLPSFQSAIIPLWLPVFLIHILILPANFSTTAILFSMVLLLCFLGGYPWRQLLAIIGAGVVMLALFVLTAKAFPGLFNNRVDTWISRVENFADGTDGSEDYQIEKAKIAIATGGIFGLGAGKSVMKNFLPQSSSDFIFAIIMEEYGLIGGVILLLLYLLLLVRIVIVAQKAETTYGRLLAIAVGLPIVFQAFINMGVAVELFPVTGQTLPLISSGGTSIWTTCLALGMVLSVSARRTEAEESHADQNIESNPLEALSGKV